MKLKKNYNNSKNNENKQADRSHEPIIIKTINMGTSGPSTVG
jgi:hypothetical protein